MSSVPTLVCNAGSRRGEHWEITAEGLRIGRDETNEIMIADGNVSRFHGRVILHNGAIWIQDAGSRNGIFVNDVRVTSNKQVGPGDAIRVGTHAFVVELYEADAEASVTVNLDSVSLPGRGPQRRWKAWPFVVAAVMVLCCVGAISLLASDDGGAGAEAPKPPPSGYSLSAALENGATTNAPPKPDPKQPLGLEDALSVASGGTAGGLSGVPDPPPGVTAQELVDQAHAHYRAGRLRDALVQYQMALKLDAECEICTRRIERLSTEIQEAVDENFEAGLRYYNSLQYQQAINAWETVLLLEPDESSAMHQRTRDYLDKARKAINPQY